MDYKDVNLAPPKTLALDVQSRESIERRLAAVSSYYPEDAARLSALLEADVVFVPTERRLLVDITGEEREFDVDLTHD